MSSKKRQCPEQGLLENIVFEDNDSFIIIHTKDSKVKITGHMVDALSILISGHDPAEEADRLAYCMLDVLEYQTERPEVEPLDLRLVVSLRDLVDFYRLSAGKDLNP